MTHDWLNTICDPHGRRDITLHPWLYPDDGGVIATDARILVWLHYAEPGDEKYPAIEGRNLDNARTVLAPERCPTVVGYLPSLTTLQEWCGPYEPSTTAPCRFGHAKGSYTCPTCGEGTVECDECSGGKVTTYPPRRLGRLGPVLIDRNQLAHAIHHLDGACRLSVGKTNVSEEYDTVRLDCPGVWTVLLMGIYESTVEATDTVKESPTLSHEEATVVTL